MDFRADRDVIEVGRDEGRFRKLRVVVRGAPIQLRDMQVIFGDDSIFDPVSRDRPGVRGALSAIVHCIVALRSSGPKTPPRRATAGRLW